MAEQTEAEAVEAIAQRAHAPKELKPGVVLGVVLAEGDQFAVEDLEQYLDNPRRKRGQVILHDADSLATYVAAHGESNRTLIYANVEAGSITVELNGHTKSSAEAGWGDHRAVLTLRPTPNWQLWAGRNERWMSQTEFAEHIEEGLVDIVEPTAAHMLEVAQTFQANAKVAFRSSTLLTNGQRQFSYEETIESRAGQQGTMAVPTEFYVGLAVYEGQREGHRIKARLQHRIERDALRLRYLLDRPYDVIKAAFDDVVGKLEQDTGLTAYRGLPSPL